MYKRHWKRALGAAALFLGMASTGQATLIDNGDGTITDTSTSLMWLKDANPHQSR